jgi:hypothetical protein
MRKLLSLAILGAFLASVTGCSSTSSAPPKAPAAPPKTTPEDKPKPP